MVHYEPMNPVRTALPVPLLAILAWSCSPGPTDPADLVVTGGTVLTVDADFSVAEAMAVRDGRIQAVGTDADIRALAGPETQVVEIPGRRSSPDSPTTICTGSGAATAWTFPASGRWTNCSEPSRNAPGRRAPASW